MSREDEIINFCGVQIFFYPTVSCVKFILIEKDSAPFKFKFQTKPGVQGFLERGLFMTAKEENNWIV